MTDWYWFI